MRGVVILYIFFQDELRLKDAAFAISGVTCSVEGRKQVWECLKFNWEHFSKKYSGFLFISIITVSFLRSEYLYLLKESVQ